MQESEHHPHPHSMRITLPDNVRRRSAWSGWMRPCGILLFALWGAILPVGICGEPDPNGVAAPYPAEWSSEAFAPSSRDDAAVADVLAGRRRRANAAWWGFDPEDVTESLQAAIRSGAHTLFVPDMGKPWIVRQTIMLKSNQEIIFEKGVSILAKEGSFTGIDDSLVRAVDMTNITLRGYGAEFVMRKEDYRKPPYKKAEWRHCLALIACADVEIYGLRLASSGGDGIYIGSGVPGFARLPTPLKGCKDILIKDVDCDDNYRQGISVISARNLLIEDCRLAGTEGTRPGAGIDFEPNGNDEYLANCIVRNCRIVDNEGEGLLVAVHGRRASFEPVSISVEECTISDNKRGALRILSPRKVRGTIRLLKNALSGRERMELHYEGHLKVDRRDDLADGEGGNIWVSQLDLTRSSAGWGQSWADRSSNFNPLRMDGQTFERGVGTHANGTIAIALRGNARSFEALVGVDDEVLDAVRDRPGGTVVFRVLTDGEERWNSGIMKAGDRPKPVAVDLDGVSYLELETGDAGDGIRCDHADWAMAHLMMKTGKPECIRPVRRDPSP